MSNGVRKDLLSDSIALDEAASSFSQHWAMGVINDEAAFLSCVSSISELLGHGKAPARTDAIVKDRCRDAYFEIIITSCRQTRLTIGELAILLETMLSTLGSRKGFKSYSDAVYLLEGIARWARFVDFEPSWHMMARGDTRRLPSSRNPNRDMWGYLKKLYTDPEAARLRVPDEIATMAPMYPGYEACVKRARREGQNELIRIYGPQVDLSLVSDKPKPQDPNLSSFMNDLTNGTLGELLLTQSL